MGIRRLWLRLVERATPQRRLLGGRIRAVRNLLKQLRIKEQALVDLRDAETDEEQREQLAARLSVLRAQRTKGLLALRELRAERQAITRRRVSAAEAVGPRKEGSGAALQQEQRFPG
jgi:hypothetical protein